MDVILAILLVTAINVGAADRALADGECGIGRPPASWSHPRPNAEKLASRKAGHSCLRSSADTIAGSRFGPRLYWPSARASPGSRLGGSAGPSGNRPR